jgi:hypothetical protein
MQRSAPSIPHDRGGSAPFGHYARIIPNPECGGCRCLDVRHATSSALKRIKVRQVAKSRRYSSDPQDLSTARAKGRPGCVFIRTFIAHWTKRSLSRDVPTPDAPCIRSVPKQCQIKLHRCYSRGRQ